MLKPKIAAWILLFSWFSGMAAQADDTAAPSSNSATSEADRPDKDFGWLHPGFAAVIMPATNSGESITIRYDVQGLTLCATIPNATDGSIAGPGHCNYRITPAGFHIPPDLLFDQSKGLFHAIEQKLKEIGEFTLAAAPMVLAAMNLGATSQGAQAVANVANPDPIDELEASYAVDKSLDNVAHYSQEVSKQSFVSIPVGVIQYDFQDIEAALMKKVNDFVNKCNKDLDDYGSYCNQQKTNVTFAVNLMSICNIPEVPAGAGEAGQPVLWTPDQPVPQACADTLKGMGPQGEILAQWLVSGGDSNSAETLEAKMKLK